MTSEMDWSHSFCLACDVQTEGNVYCSEACRLADYEDVSSSSSLNSSPISQSTFSWSGKSHSDNTYSIKYDSKYIDNHSIHSGSSSTHLYTCHSPKSSPSTKKDTKPSVNSSSSCSNICSLRENKVFTNTETTQISQDSERALRLYANSFDRSRYGRRYSGY